MVVVAVDVSMVMDETDVSAKADVSVEETNASVDDSTTVEELASTSSVLDA
jgi:hypothetical protein